MQDSEIYTKTEAGREEIRTRAQKLSMAMRAILLMVDGHRTVADLRGFIAGSKAPADALDVLLAQGLITATREPAATPATSSDPATAVPANAALHGAPSATLHAPTSAPATRSGAATLPPSPESMTATPSVPDTASHGEQGDPRTRFDRLYTAMNEIVRDFLPAHRRYFLQLKIERCGTVEELFEVLQDLRLALVKARGDAFASDVVARLRSIAA